MDIYQLPAAVDVDDPVDFVWSDCLGGSLSPAPAPTHMDMVDLVADSLRALCQDPQDAERVFWWMARAIDLHLADTLAGSGPRRWQSEALDAILSLVSASLQQTAAARGDGRSSVAVSVAETAPWDPCLRLST